MPLETMTGHKISALLSRAQEEVGSDAFVLSIRRTPSGRGGRFELVVADPETAGEWKRMVGLRGVGGEETRMAPRLLAAEVRRDCRPLVIALVGPTGAGKTTTIAKLANHPEVFGGSAVGLVCLDTYRVGAMEQCRIYAELSRTPLEVVYDSKEIERALRRLRGCRVLLVDTAGRGPGANGDLEETRSHLRRLKPDEVHLTLPAGLNPRFARTILSDHLRCGLTHILATKMDEFPEDETVFHLAAEFKIPMRWVANGQEVPGDLISAQAWGARLSAAGARAAARSPVEAA